MKKLVLSLVSFVALSGVGFAGGEIVPAPVVMEENQNSFYLGLGIAAASNRDSENELDFSSITYGQDRTGNIVLTAGYDYNDFIGLEGRYSFSFSDEDQVETKGWSIFLKPQYTFENSSFKIYGLLGYGGMDVNDIGNEWVVDVEDTGLQYGIGASYSLKDALGGENVSIFADYTVLGRGFEGLFFGNDVEGDFDAITVGVTYNF